MNVMKALWTEVQGSVREYQKRDEGPRGYIKVEAFTWGPGKGGAREGMML